MRKPFSLYLLILSSAAGLLDSLTIVLKELALKSDPNVFTSCNISPLFDCAKVSTSQYAHFAGIPVSILGILFYEAALVVGIFLLFKLKLPKWQRQIISALVLISLVFSYRLAFLSYFGLGVLCLYCVGSYISTTLLTISWFWYLKQTHPSEKSKPE